MLGKKNFKKNRTCLEVDSDSQWCFTFPKLRDDSGWYCGVVPLYVHGFENQYNILYTLRATAEKLRICIGTRWEN